MALVAAIALCGGCRRDKAPSPEYREAHQRFSRLYAAQLDEAFLDPQMAEIEAQLTAVPQRSLDHGNAQELLRRIREGRARMEAELAQRGKAAELPPVVFAPSRPATSFPAEGTPTDGEPAEEAPDAGVPAPVAGMPQAELRARFGDCLEEAPSLMVEGVGERPALKLRDTAQCRQRLPSLSGQYLLLDADKVLAVVQQAQVRQQQPDAGN